MSLKEGRVLEVDNAFAGQGWRGCRGSLIIEEKMRMHKLKCWEIRNLQTCDQNKGRTKQIIEQIHNTASLSILFVRNHAKSSMNLFRRDGTHG